MKKLNVICALLFICFGCNNYKDPRERITVGTIDGKNIALSSYMLQLMKEGAPDMYLQSKLSMIKGAILLIVVENTLINAPQKYEVSEDRLRKIARYWVTSQNFDENDPVFERFVNMEKKQLPVIKDAFRKNQKLPIEYHRLADSYTTEDEIDSRLLHLEKLPAAFALYYEIGLYLDRQINAATLLHPNMEIEIEKELPEIIKSNLAYSDLSKEEQIIAISIERSELILTKKILNMFDEGRISIADPNERNLFRQHLVNKIEELD